MGGRKEKTSYREIKKLAHENGGFLLTSHYEYEKINTTLSYTDFLWQCGKKHKPFEKKLMYVKRGSWCPECSTKKKWNYERLKKLAERRGLEKNKIPGKILTSRKEFEELKEVQYPNKTKYLWSCQIESHDPWKARPDSIKNGSW